MILSNYIASGKIPHALLFTGGDLAEIAKQFARDLLGKYPHPDLREYFPEGKAGMHPVQNIRALTTEVGFVPYLAKWKLFILHDAERMLPTSSNALLKTLEEPTDKTIIVLLSSHPENILPTLLSRCQKIEFPSKQEQVRHRILDVLAKKIPLFEEDDQIESLLETILLWYRDRMLLNMKGGEVYLSYPEYRDEIHKTPFVSLDYVESALAQVRQGLERSMKLSICLEALFYKLRNPSFSSI